MESKDDVIDNKPVDKQQSQPQPEQQDDLIDDYVLENFDENDEKDEKDKNEENNENEKTNEVINEVISQVITEVYILSKKTQQFIKKYDFLVDKINIKLENYKEINQRLPYTTPGTAISLNIISARNNYIYNKLKNLKNKVSDTRYLILEGNTIDEELYENYIGECNKITNNM